MNLNFSPVSMLSVIAIVCCFLTDEIVEGFGRGAIMSRQRMKTYGHMQESGTAGGGRRRQETGRFAGGTQIGSAVAELEHLQQKQHQSSSRFGPGGANGDRGGGSGGANVRNSRFANGQALGRSSQQTEVRRHAVPAGRPEVQSLHSASKKIALGGDSMARFARAEAGSTNSANNKRNGFFASRLKALEQAVPVYPGSGFVNEADGAGANKRGDDQSQPPWRYPIQQQAEGQADEGAGAEEDHKISPSFESQDQAAMNQENGIGEPETDYDDKVEWEMEGKPQPQLTALEREILRIAELRQNNRLPPPLLPIDLQIGEDLSDEDEEDVEDFEENYPLEYYYDDPSEDEDEEGEQEAEEAEQSQLMENVKRFGLMRRKRTPGLPRSFDLDEQELKVLKKVVEEGENDGDDDDGEDPDGWEGSDSEKEDKREETEEDEEDSEETEEDE